MTPHAIALNAIAQSLERKRAYEAANYRRPPPIIIRFNPEWWKAFKPLDYLTYRDSYIKEKLSTKDYREWRLMNARHIHQRFADRKLP